MEIVNSITLSGKIEAPVQLMETEGYHGAVFTIATELECSREIIRVITFTEACIKVCGEMVTEQNIGKRVAVSGRLGRDKKQDAELYRPVDYSNPAVSKTNVISDPVYSACKNRLDGMDEKKMQYLQQRLDQLDCQVHSLDRVCVAYGKTSMICPVAYYMLYELSYKHKEGRLKNWNILAKELCRSKTSIKKGIDFIIHLVYLIYDSEYTTEELVNLDTEGLKKSLPEDILETAVKY